MSRSTTAKMAAAKRKKRPPSVLHPNDRRTRNADPRGLAYMQWVRNQPCALCGPRQIHPTEAAHISGNLAAKASNYHAIPLCMWCHRGSPESEERLKRRFGPHHGIDIEALIAQLNAEFDRLHPPGTKGLLEEGRDGG